MLDVSPAPDGSPPWTDGAAVFVPAGLDGRDQLRAVAVQAALLRAGSLDPGVLGRLRRAGALRRYLAVEGHRALVAADADGLLPPAARTLADHDVAARSGSPVASAVLATGRDAIDDPPALFGTIRPRDLRPGTDPAVTGGETARHVAASGAGGDLQELDDGEDDGSAVVDFLSSPVGGGGALGRLLKRFFGDGRSPGSGPAGADAPTHRSRRSTARAGTVAVSTVVAPARGGEVPGKHRGTTYPEWDVYGRRYRPDWCTVVEMDAPAATALVPPSTERLRRPLARLGLDLERRRRQLQGDDLDIDAVVDTRVEVRAGSPPDEGLYLDTVRTRRDLSVLILLDVSGSAAEPSAAGGTVHDHQRAAAAGLMVALHDLGDRVAVHGFRSQGRRAVQILPAKRFGDPVDAGVLQRLGGFTPGGYTRLGAAIRHGTAVLDRDSGTPRRLLVVLSDGFAYDHGYEGAYGEADARRALAEARRRGTGCLCLSIAAGTDAAALRRIFGSAAHAAIPRVELLPGVIGPLFRSALRTSAAQRRVAQRRGRTRERLQLERRTA